MLCLHIEKFHLLDYLDLALQKDRDWLIQVKVVKDCITNGYSLQELKSLVDRGVGLKNLPPHPVIPTPNPGSGDTNDDHRSGTPPFSIAIFHKSLVNFIIADDQSLQVVECKEFRQLLPLLKSDLKESDIPHHTKIKSSIIQVWKDYFVILKTELQVRHFSMDNAENNTSMMDQLADLLNKREPPLKFVTKDRHIMCFAHIINLCIQDIISGFTAADVADDLTRAWHDDTEEKDKYIEAMRGNPLALAHYTKELAKVKISDAEWTILQDYENILKVPHKVQQWMSTEARPTLSHVVLSFKLFMTAWEKMQQENQHLAPFIEVGLIKARHYYNCMDNMKAYIISMLVDPFLQFHWIKMHWVQDWVVCAEESMITLMKEYRRLKVLEDAITQSLSQFNSLNTLAQQFNICNMALGGPRPTEQQSVREEYQLYIDSGYVPETMDPLKFWEVNQMRFPMLFAIAMDYLPIQASSVPCERVFSLSAETDTKKHNRIVYPILMEALQMLKYHLKQERLDFMVNWTVSPESLVEDEPEE
ncbi:hypothetical protein PISMIDRAFT_124027, partial [Pisolithus microcarpus 441]